MKKLLLLSLAISIGYCASAQKQSKSLVPKNIKDISAPVKNKISGKEVLPIVMQENNYYTMSKKSIDPTFGEPIGITFYDLQTNSGLPNRILKESNGNVTAVWTMATSSAANYPTRGTGFNYFNGSNWLDAPTDRIEGLTRTGWPNVAITGTNHIVVSHGGSSAFKSTKPISSTTWDNSAFPAPNTMTWPRLVADGNIVHVIGCADYESPYGTTGFLAGALVYWRSTDGGANWENERLLPNFDTIHFSPEPNYQDDYNMDIKGNTVVILTGNVLSGTFMWKSTDAGVNWSYIEILPAPSRKFWKNGGLPLDFNGDAQQDQIIGSDGSSCVVLDNNGMAHCFFGVMKNTSDGAGSSYYPGYDGIYYWNESMGPISYQYHWEDIGGVQTYIAIPDTVNFQPITYIKDLNGDGQINFSPNNTTGDGYGYYQTSLTSQINACVDNNNNIIMVYSGLVDSVWTTVPSTSGNVDRNYRNLWMLFHLNGHAYNDWDFDHSKPDSGRIVSDDVTECVYANMLNAPYSYDTDSLTIAFTYQADGFPGNSLQPTGTANHGIVENTIYYKMLKVRRFDVGISENDVVKTAPVVYPNPTTSFVNVSYSLTNDANVTLSIYNTVGQQIMTTTKNVTAGDAKVTLNIESLTHGVYFVKSNINGKTYTNKLVVK